MRLRVPGCLGWGLSLSGFSALQLFKLLLEFTGVLLRLLFAFGLGEKGEKEEQ
jgi:hypothetical protein